MMTMRFRKFGKTYQLRIENANDLAQVLELNEALWVATSAPASAFSCDPKLMELINKDGSGRMNSQEMRDAIRWMLEVLSDTTLPASPDEPLKLSAIETSTPDGERLVSSAREVLEAQDCGGSEAVSLTQVREFLNKIKQRPLNGDGVVVPDAADGDVRRLIEDIVACGGNAEDASGKFGVDQPCLDGFIAAVRNLLDWREAGSGANADSLVPFGVDTPAIYKCVASIRQEVDAFFHACSVLRYDSAQSSHFATAKMEAVAATDREGMDEWLKSRPLAEVNAEGILPLSRERLNPYYADKVERLRDEVLPRVLKTASDMLDHTAWSKVNAALKPYGDYIQSKKGADVEILPPERLAAYRDGVLAEKVKKLIGEDNRMAQVRADAIKLERLLLYRGYLKRLANNFVSFSELYDMSDRALFEMGSLVMDGRWFNLALPVTDVAAHQQMAKESNIFTLYVEVEGLAGAAPFTVAVPAMAGAKGNLHVGKRGVFFDTEGKEHNARVTSIIANPISVREALCAPFVRLWGFLIGKIESMSTTSEKALQQQADAMLKVPQGGQPQTTGNGQLGSAGMLMGLSVSVAAVGSAFAFITKTLASLSRGQVVLGVLGAALVVMVPVSLIAIMKLRRQDLSALLEGCGWAINARMRPTREQRRQFTVTPRYPEGAEGAPSRRRMYLLLAIAAALLVILLVKN